jgi:hypothetical protein
VPTAVHSLPLDDGHPSKGPTRPVCVETADAKERKAHGIHYTPPRLAAYLAHQVVSALVTRQGGNGRVSILDPACGDGELLRAIAAAAPPSLKARLALAGFDTDREALTQAGLRLTETGVASVDLRCVDFLSGFVPVGSDRQMGFQFAEERRDETQSSNRRLAFYGQISLGRGVFGCRQGVCWHRDHCRRRFHSRRLGFSSRTRTPGGGTPPSSRHAPWGGALASPRFARPGQACVVMSVGSRCPNWTDPMIFLAWYLKFFGPPQRKIMSKWSAFRRSWTNWFGWPSVQDFTDFGLQDF